MAILAMPLPEIQDAGQDLARRTVCIKGSPQELVKTSNIDDSVRWRFWVHSAVDTQRVDGDSGVAGVQGISARAGRRGQDLEAVGAAQARSQRV